MEARAVIQLNLVKRGETLDIDVPLEITAGELIQGLNEAYELGLNTEDVTRCYVKAENPIALMHGKKTLADYGIMSGSTINVTE